MEAAGTEEDDAEGIVVEVQCSMNELIEQKKKETPGPITITKDFIEEVLENTDLEEHITELVKEKCSDLLVEEEPQAENFVDNKTLSKAEIRAIIKENRELKKEIARLKNQI